MTLKIISTTEIVFEGTTDLVTLPGVMGSFTVLNKHASLISTLAPGDIVYHVDGVTQRFHVNGGIVDIDNNVVSVCIY
jgi:F-type H+-transporting ATPase subunit epsilon